jgi:dihydrofolate reductase
MSQLKYSTSMSLDGFVAGVNQSPEHPLGEGGERLHEWMRNLAAWRREAGLEGGETNASTAVLEAEDRGIGAIIMGRNMFGGGPGPWGVDPWNGWWGVNPPFHLPVFVLTHHPRPTLELRGGTTFHFVDGIGLALELARHAARGADVAVSGGASAAQQYLAAGLVDEIVVHHVPTFLGEGVRLFEGHELGEMTLEQMSVIPAPGVTHITYRVNR